MNPATIYALMAIYWPYGAYGQNHPPEDPFYGTPVCYNEQVDQYWSEATVESQINFIQCQP